MKSLLLILLIASIQFMGGCSKDPVVSRDGTRLFAALHAKDSGSAEAELRPMLTNYTEANLQKLKADLQTFYMVDASICFECIQTLPAQTELTVHYSLDGVSETRFIDLTPGTGNSMKIIGIHE